MLTKLFHIILQYWKSQFHRSKIFLFWQKETLRDNPDQFLSVAHRLGEMVYEYTSGTTGVPLKCGKSKREMMISSKIIWQWRNKWNKKNEFKRMLTITYNCSTMDANVADTNGLFGSLQCAHLSVEDIKKRTQMNCFCLLSVNGPHGL